MGANACAQATNAGEGSRRRRCVQFVRRSLAGEPGFEPRQTESESVVLPLHHSPTELPNKFKWLLNCSAMAGGAFAQIGGSGVTGFYSVASPLASAVVEGIFAIPT